MRRMWIWLTYWNGRLISLEHSIPDETRVFGSSLYEHISSTEGLPVASSVELMIWTFLVGWYYLFTGSFLGFYPLVKKKESHMLDHVKKFASMNGAMFTAFLFLLFATAIAILPFSVRPLGETILASVALFGVVSVFIGLYIWRIHGGGKDRPY